jgi:hypothetical protein
VANRCQDTDGADKQMQIDGTIRPNNLSSFWRVASGLAGFGLFEEGRELGSFISFAADFY